MYEGYDLVLILYSLRYCRTEIQQCGGVLLDKNSNSIAVHDTFLICVASKILKLKYNNPNSQSFLESHHAHRIHLYNQSKYTS